MPDIKYLIFFSCLFLGVPVATLLCVKFRELEKYVLFLTLFFTCEMVDINFFSMENYRGTSKGFEFGMVDISLCILFSLVIIQRRERKIIKCPPGTALYGLYFFFSVLSIVNADKLLYSSFEVSKMVRMYLYYWTLFNFLIHKDRLQVIMPCVAVIIIYVFFSVIKQKYVGGLFQCAGPFPHQNSLVMYMSVFGMLALSYLLNSRHANAWFWFFVFGMSAVCIVATLSRAGMALFVLNVLIVYSVSLLNRSKHAVVRKRKWAIGLLLPIGGLLVLVKAYDSISERVLNAPQESTMVRVQLAEAAVKMANDKWLGVGLNNFGHKINPPYEYSSHIPMANPNDPDEKNGLVETVYLMVAAEAGWHTLAIFLLLLFYFYFKNIKNYFRYRRSDYAYIAIALMAALICMYLQSSLEWVLKQTNNFYQLMFLFALIAAIPFSLSTNKGRSLKEGVA